MEDTKFYYVFRGIILVLIGKLETTLTQIT